MSLTVGFHVMNSDVCSIYFVEVAFESANSTYFSHQLHVVIEMFLYLFECCDLDYYQRLPPVLHRTHQMIRVLRSVETVVFIDLR